MVAISRKVQYLNVNQHDAQNLDDFIDVQCHLEVSSPILYQQREIKGWHLMCQLPLL